MEKKGRQQQILFSWAPKSQQMVTAALKRHLLLERKAMTNLDSVLESRDITLLTKIHIVSYGFSSSHVWMWELAIRKVECWRIDAFELCCRRLKSLGLQGDKTSQSLRKSFLNIHWKNWYWSFYTLAGWCEELTPLKRPWWWERLKTEGKGDN